MKFRIQSLQTRIVVLFMALLLLVQVAGFLAIRGSIDEHARKSVNEQLLVGERVFGRLMEQNAGKLAQGARILAADYGFRAAVASDDRGTIASALSNHGERIGATVSLFYTADRVLKGSSVENGKFGEALAERRRVDGLIDQAARDGWAAGPSLVGRQLYQLVVVPVRAPVLIGWVLMGFAVDRAMADDMRALSRLDLSFLVNAGDGGHRVLASSLGASAAQALMAARGLPRPGIPGEIAIDGEQYGTLVAPLLSSESDQVVTVLQRSISEAVAPFAQLQVTLMLLTLAGLLISVVGSVLTARRITRPMTALAESARRMGAGEYDLPIAVDGDQEIGNLARAFNHMREGIAEREGQIRRLAYWDKLTGLPNRDLFLDRMRDAIASARANGGSCSVLMMDLDRFKHVNDVLGHAFGDALLQEVARRLEGALVRRTDAVARFGGDEFAVLLPDQDAPQARAIVERVRQALEHPMQVQRQTIDMSAGIGLATFPEHADNADLLLARAEIAMYAAKQRRAGALVYDPSFDQKSQDTLSMLSELRHAVEKDELVLYFQPKLSFSDGAMMGVETLVRWVHPQRGFVPPGDFIPFAEHTGFIADITQWVMQKSIEQAAAWRREGMSLSIAVNLSTRDLMDQELPRRFAEMLARHDVKASSFCLEITESAIMDDPQRALATLDRLHAMEFKLSIDDFGTGYSSLAYLKRLPVHELKIDRSFVSGMETDRDDATIVRSTIDLGHNMGMRVVAEGVENEAVWHLLAAAGCDIGQGYFMSKPIPAAQLADWLAKWRPPSLVHGTAPVAEVRHLYAVS